MIGIQLSIMPKLGEQLNITFNDFILIARLYAKIIRLPGLALADV